MGLLEEQFKASFWGTEPPKTPDWIEWVHRSMGKTHCDTCLRLDKCWFVDEEDKMPALPQHPFCHCTKEPLPISQVLLYATAASDYSKFNPYLFDPENYYKHGKAGALESWGYTVADSQYLKDEIERQGLEKYTSGEYTLHKLRDEGQLIDIRVEIPRKDQAKTASFVTGWMVYPNGHIQLVTPFGNDRKG